MTARQAPPLLADNYILATGPEDMLERLASRVGGGEGAPFDFGRIVPAPPEFDSPEHPPVLAYSVELSRWETCPPEDPRLADLVDWLRSNQARFGPDGASEWRKEHWGTEFNAQRGGLYRSPEGFVWRFTSIDGVPEPVVDALRGLVALEFPGVGISWNGGLDEGLAGMGLSDAHFEAMSPREETLNRHWADRVAGHVAKWVAAGWSAASRAPVLGELLGAVARAESLDSRVARILLGHGARPDAETLAEALSRVQEEEFAEMLLKAGADPNMPCGEDELSPMATAVERGLYEVVEVMFRYGADPNQMGADGLPLLHTAAYLADDGLVAMLCKAGADTEARDAFGRTALFVAVIMGHPTSVRKLLAAGADPGVKGPDGLSLREAAAAEILRAGAEFGRFRKQVRECVRLVDKAAKRRRKESPAVAAN